MSAVERVQELVQPIVEREGVDLYDIEHESGILRIMLDKPGGIDVDTIGNLSRDISDALDLDDPIPDSRYLLEVTSPGIERKLRVQGHFEAQLGKNIAVKVQRNVEGDRRFEGRLESVTADGIEVAVGDTTRTVAYTDIESARLIFDWQEEFAKKKHPKQQETDNSITNKKVSAR